MTWRRIPPPTKFEKARRLEAWRRLARLVRGTTDEENLLPLEEVQKRMRAFEQTYEGVKPIPVDKIVGTSDRLADFDEDFLPRNEELRDRWIRIEKAFPEGDFPPIAVYELDERYFVVDGHHRVAVAKRSGVEAIDAEVTRLIARYEMPEDADIAEIILAEQEQMFMEESGLARARPEARVEFSRPTGYPELLELIKAHGYQVMVDRNEVVPIDQIAGDWYDWLYVPTVEAIRAEGLTESLEGTEADLFLWVYQRRRALLPQLGGMSLKDAVRRVREDESNQPKGRARRAFENLRPSRDDGGR
jgi:hypothetical protein